jgi:hypothetical protein
MTDTEMILVMDPEGPIEAPRRVHRAELTEPGRRTWRIGVLDNGKPNAALLLRSIAEDMAAMMPGSTVHEISKFGDETAGKPMRDHKFAWLMKECDVILTGSGD